MTMREARIICPVGSKAVLWLRQSLVAHFGGYTSTEAIGAWTAPDGAKQTEGVYVFDVAMEAVPLNTQKLRGIARYLAVLARQECIYVRHADGAVEFVTKEAM